MKKTLAFFFTLIFLFSAIINFTVAESNDDILEGYNYYVKYKGLIDALESSNVPNAETEFQTIIKEIKNAGANAEGYYEVDPGVYVKVPVTPYVVVRELRGLNKINFFNIDDLEIYGATSKAGERRIYIKFKGSYTGSDMNANLYWQLFDDEEYKVGQDHIYFGKEDVGTKFKDKWVSFKMPSAGYYSIDIIAPEF